MVAYKVRWRHRGGVFSSTWRAHGRLLRGGDVEMRPGKSKKRMGTLGKENSMRQGAEVSTTWYLVGITSMMCCVGGCEQERSKEASAFR